MEIEARQQFTYDALYRLLKATGREKDQLGMPTEADIEAYPVSSKGQASNYTQHFTYDKLGNILKIQHTAAQSPNSWTRDYVYESINNRLLKHDSNQANAVYTYDAHGNMLTMPHLPTMEWDSVDHLHKSVRGNDTTWYKYDVDGNRRRKITDKQNGTRVERIYHGDYELYREYNADNTIKEETRTVHVSDGEKRIATVDYKTVENGVAITSYTDVVRYQYDNHLGSACLELDANALIITYEEYHPFGTSSYKLADNDTEVKRKRCRYVGKERDEETGLYYYGARYYAAWIARFVSVDPLQHKYPHYTPYQYAGNKPITYIDLDGLEEKKLEEVNPKDISLTSTKNTGLILGGDVSLGINDIKSALPNSFHSKISLDENNKVVFNITKEEALASDDVGVMAIYKLTNSSKTYLWEVAEKTEYIRQNGIKEESQVSSVLGASQLPDRWMYVSRETEYIKKYKKNGQPVTGTKKCNVYVPNSVKPVNPNVDYQRTMNPTFNLVEDPRASIVLHELLELVFEGEFNLPYSTNKKIYPGPMTGTGAHNMAVRLQTKKLLPNDPRNGVNHGSIPISE